MALPPTGLMGYEQALQQGLSGSTSIYDQANQQARNDLYQSWAGADANLGAAGQAAQGLYNQGQGQLGGAQNAINQQFGQGLSALAQIQGGVNQQIGQGVGALQGFADPGRQAMASQAALSGAMGADAQRQAFSDYSESPEQAFLRDQGQRALLANSAAIGGIGGGNVRQDLVRFGTGLAAQDINNRFNRLGQVSGQGLQAAGQIGNLRGQQAGLTTSLGQTGASLRGQQAGLTGQLGQARADLGTQQSALQTNLAAQRAGNQQQAGQNLANLSTLLGGQVGQNILGTGQQLAQGRMNVGNQLASATQAASGNISNILQQEGAGLADILGAGGSGIANLLSGTGVQSAQQQQALMALLANLATQQGSSVAGLSPLPGVQINPGMLGGIGQAASGIGSAYTAFSDRRLKTNVRKVGVSPGGHNLYVWDWNEEGERVASRDQPRYGVMADEVSSKVPEAVVVGADGYLRVDYSRIH